MKNIFLGLLLSGLAPLGPQSVKAMELVKTRHLPAKVMVIEPPRLEEILRKGDGGRPPNARPMTAKEAIEVVVPMAAEASKTSRNCNDVTP